MEQWSTLVLSRQARKANQREQWNNGIDRVDVPGNPLLCQ